MSLVAPLAGAWIEIGIKLVPAAMIHVAPLAGAWIEIIKCFCSFRTFPFVAPLAGAWIEILKADIAAMLASSRTPRGCVD